MSKNATREEGARERPHLEVADFALVERCRRRSERRGGFSPGFDKGDDSCGGCSCMVGGSERQARWIVIGGKRTLFGPLEVLEALILVLVAPSSALVFLILLVVLLVLEIRIVHLPHALGRLERRRRRSGTRARHGQRAREEARLVRLKRGEHGGAVVVLLALVVVVVVV